MLIVVLGFLSIFAFGNSLKREFSTYLRAAGWRGAEEMDWMHKIVQIFSSEKPVCLRYLRQFAKFEYKINCRIDFSTA